MRLLETLGLARATPTGPLNASEEVRVVRDIEGWTARLGVFIISIVLFRLGFEMWWVGRIHENAWIQFFVVLLYAGGLAFLFLSFTRMRHERLHLAGFIVLLAALAFYAIVAMTVVNIHYTSDAMLFVHQSAYLFSQGVNPYTTPLVGGYDQFAVPYYVETPTTAGGQVTNLNYPALSFLVYAPFVMMGVTDLRPVSLGFLFALLTLFFLATPKHLRLLTVSALFLSSFFIAFSISSFDIVFIYFLIGSALLWQRNQRMALVLFGLAAATKQIVWFMAPFLLIALYKESRAQSMAEKWADIGKTSAWGAGAFLVPNLPFMLWDFGAWLDGLMTPFGLGGDTLVPLSQGITVPFYTGLLDFDPFLLHLAAGMFLLFLLVLYAARYERLKMFAWVVPPFVLALTERSLQNYFEMFYPIGLLVLVRAYPLLKVTATEAVAERMANAPDAGTRAPPAPRPALGAAATALVAQRPADRPTTPRSR